MPVFRIAMGGVIGFQYLGDNDAHESINNPFLMGTSWGANLPTTPDCLQWFYAPKAEGGYAEPYNESARVLFAPKSWLDTLFGEFSFIPAGTAFFQSFSETASFSEAFTKKNIFRRSFSETASFSETFTRKIKKLMAETASFSETLTKKIPRVFSETASFYEALTRRLIKRLSFSETASFTETLTTLFIQAAIVVSRSRWWFHRWGGRE